MHTIMAPIKKTEEVKKESAALVMEYIAFMCECDPSEEIEIEEYIRIHGSKEYNEWWDAEKERKKELREHGIIVN